MPLPTALIFNEDFDRPRPTKPQPGPASAEPVFTTADLAAARAEAWRAGHLAGLSESETTSASLAHHALITIAERLDTARMEANAIAEASAEAIAILLMDAFAAAFPALCAQHGEAELRAIVRTVLAGLREEPAITIRAEPHMAAAIAQEIDRLDPDIMGRVRFTPTDAMAPGEIRIAWRAGSAARDIAGLWAEIEAVLAPAGLLTQRTIKENEYVE